jgi:hypothetical protein
VLLGTVRGKMQAARKSFVRIALAAAAAIFCSGCPALMIPGLAYSGYQYTHKKDQPAATASSTHSTESATAPRKKSKTAQTAKSTTSPPQKIPDSEIE